MHYLPPLVIHSPASIAQAQELAAGLGEDAAWYAGGTELLLAMKVGALRYGTLIDVKGLQELRQVARSADGGSVDVGAAVTYADVLRSQTVLDAVPALAEVLVGIGNVRVRASGTLGGNLAFADPHSDVATIGLALDARCEVLGADGARWLAVDELLVDQFETVLTPGELLTRVRFPLQDDRVVRYQRFRIHERPAVTVCLSASVRDGALVDPRVVVGAAVPVATRRAEAESLLAGDVGSLPGRIEDVAAAAVEGLDVIDDEEGSAEYKLHLARTFVSRLATGLSDPDRPTVTD